MRQVTGLTSTYSSDEFGICSALFELGGLVVMHDASGCNSTYTTHDEPRWYDMDSMIYVSAISEMEAILGDDEKLIRDLVTTVRELQPRFVAVVGAPIPYMIGTDLAAIARRVEEECHIPAFGFPANGMNLYTKGISMALAALTERFCTEEMPRSAEPVMNILGMTPLDFSVNGSVESLWRWGEAYGFRRGVCMAMGSSLDDIAGAGAAHVNLVVSYGGLEAARILHRRYGTPYLIGVPFGSDFSREMGDLLVKTAAGTAGSRTERAGGAAALPGRGADRKGPDGRTGGFGSAGAQRPGGICAWQDTRRAGSSGRELLVVGESVQAVSYAAAVELETGLRTRVLCPVDTCPDLLREGDAVTSEEDDLIDRFSHAEMITADPLFRSLAPETADLYPFPHTAFSGRIYDSTNENRIGRPAGDFLRDPVKGLRRGSTIIDARKGTGCSDLQFMEKAE